MLNPSSHKKAKLVYDYALAQSLFYSIYRLFGLRSELVHHLLNPNFFVWFVEWNGLIHHRLIAHKLIISTSMRIEEWSHSTKFEEWTHLRNGLMMHHPI